MAGVALKDVKVLTVLPEPEQKIVALMQRRLREIDAQAHTIKRALRALKAVKL